MSNFLNCVFNKQGLCIYCMKAGGIYCEVLAKLPLVSVGDEKSAKSDNGFYGGPGSELSRLLAAFGIVPTPGCHCLAKAAQMDDWGPEECEKPDRIQEVLAVMRKEASARGLPFVEAVGRIFIRRAIANWRRKQAARAIGIGTPPPADSGPPG